MPAWSPDGQQSTSRARTATGVFGLWRVGSGGGVPQPVARPSWDWKTPTATRRRCTHGPPVLGGPIPARVTLAADGHPAFADRSAVVARWAERPVFMYSSGHLEFELPAGEYRIEASARLRAPAGAERPSAAAAVQRRRVADPSSSRRSAGRRWTDWYCRRSPFPLELRRPVAARARSARADDARRGSRCGDAAVGEPAHAPHRRGLLRLDAGRAAGHPVRPGSAVALSRAYRTHRHQDAVLAVVLGPRLSGLRPRRPVERRGPAADAQQGGVNSYVHPVTIRAPVRRRGAPRHSARAGLGRRARRRRHDRARLPVERRARHRRRLVSAAERRRPLTPSAGTDAMVDFFRTMAIGTTRVYVHVPQPFTMERYLDGLKAGRSFVSNGPLLQFRVDNAARRRGQAVRRRRRMEAQRRLGAAVRTRRGAGQRRGRLDRRRPEASRARRRSAAPSRRRLAAGSRRVCMAGRRQWPAMDSYPFAHTAPVWFGSVGSTDRAAAQRAAVDLLAALDVAESRIRDAYKEVPTPILLGRIHAARQKLAPLAR